MQYMLHQQQEEEVIQTPLAAEPVGEDSPTQMSNLSAILNQKPSKKLSKGCSRKNSQISGKNSGTHAISKNKAPTNCSSVYSRQAILELLPQRSRGRPTKLDKDLRTALKSKKFSFANQPDDVKHYIEKLRSKQKSKVRK